MGAFGGNTTHEYLANDHRKVGVAALAPKDGLVFYPSRAFVTLFGLLETLEGALADTEDLCERLSIG